MSQRFHSFPWQSCKSRRKFCLWNTLLIALELVLPPEMSPAQMSSLNCIFWWTKNSNLPSCRVRTRKYEFCNGCFWKKMFVFHWIWIDKNFQEEYVGNREIILLLCIIMYFLYTDNKVKFQLTPCPEFEKFQVYFD